MVQKLKKTSGEYLFYVHNNLFSLKKIKPDI